MDDLVALRAILDEIDGDSFETLEGRVSFQKRIYLAQAAGIPLGYRFVWNQYGPYSKRLAEDGRRLEILGDSIYQGDRIVLTDLADEALAKYRGVVDKPADIPLSEGAWLELLSSLHFIVERGSASPVDPDELKVRLRDLKPHLANEDALEEAVQRVRTLASPETAPAVR